MQDTYADSQPVKSWFWIGAVGFLLFMLTGVGGYLLTVYTPLDQLPAEQQAKLAAMPAWQMGVYAIAVWSGLLGSVLLILRRRWSVPVLLLSLMGAIGTFLPFAIVPAVRALGTQGDAIAAAIVITLCAASYWFARGAQQKGWLR